MKIQITNADFGDEDRRIPGWEVFKANTFESLACFTIYREMMEWIDRHGHEVVKNS